jgi:uncharacterized hydrophobic protein (TIGR00341 family)
VPLRLLELTVPSEEVEKVSTLCQDSPILHIWTSGSANATSPTSLVHVLVDAQHVEALSDALATRFGWRDGRRLITLPVEATVPPVPPEEEPDQGEDVDQDAAPEAAEPQRISREELYEDLAEASRVSTVYAVMVGLSTLVAAVGLVRGDIAIVIGAMVIAPLLGPNVALSLACVLGDPGLAKRSLKAIGVGVAIAAALSLLLGLVLRVDPFSPELASRTAPGFADIVLAFAAGGAGSLAFTSGVPAVVVGVMVAVALLPPLVVAGLLAGGGYAKEAVGALTLTLTNVTCINLAAMTTFFLQKVRPRTWWEAERARKATRIAITTWIAMLLVLLALMLSSHLRLL